MDLKAAITFPDWASTLDAAPLPEGLRRRYKRCIVAFLTFCRDEHVPASVGSIRRFLAAGNAEAAPALRWFYRAARGESGPDMPAARGGDGTELQSASPESRSGERRSRRDGTPPPGATDLGVADWERALITAVRERGYLWRTEETYRGWAGRFAQFLHPRSPSAASAADVGAFLSDLAVRQRARPSTQKQALNALVFLLREALRQQVGEIDFRRATPRRRVPTVLSRKECARLFGQLEGTTRLMAELAYGSGLRLMELLRLRVQHVDFERRQLTVAGGKGDKDRITVLPEQLVEPLRAHVERLRGLHAQDRAAGLPGVWLPEGLARKYPKAGERFGWQWLCCSLAAL